MINIILFISFMLPIDIEPYWFVTEHNGSIIVMDWEPAFPERTTFIYRGNTQIFKASSGITHYEQDLPHFGVDRFTAVQKNDKGKFVYITSYLTMGRLKFDPVSNAEGYYVCISKTPEIEEAIQHDIGLSTNIALINFHLKPGEYWLWVKSYNKDQVSDPTDPIQFLWEHILERP